MSLLLPPMSGSDNAAQYILDLNLVSEISSSVLFSLTVAGHLALKLVVNVNNYRLGTTTRADKKMGLIS